METRAFETRVTAAKREIRSRSLDGIERRTVRGAVEIREGDAGWQIVGHGYVFNRMSENLGGFREIVEPGFGKDVLAKAHDIRGLINHNPDLLLGRTAAGTMTVEEDEDGGAYVIDAPDTSYANDLRVSLKRRDITQSSFAFRIARDGEVWEEDDETGLLLRRLVRASGLYDMSPVTYPAYPDADSGARIFVPTDISGDDDVEVDVEITDDVEVDATRAATDDTAPDGERHDDEAASQRVEDGPAEDRQADDEPVTESEPWRLAAAKRRMALRERA